MANPEINHGFVFNSQGEIDVIQSPFFDLGFGFNNTVEEYVDRILLHLADVVDEQRPTKEWKITGRLPASPPPATFPTTKLLDSFFLEYEDEEALAEDMKKTDDSKRRMTGLIILWESGEANQD
ncbi:hypothetical protein MA16_Dca026056 [Dendrobium catenatum]|uniref:Uncharacterized protein n=1 Tax=Dendrobium catenatum TaxID=906689 RepID=A0A2I0VEZ5_9ASPA|nr:hypothetical protein MA16_Dca026056 [Dendrobium catenatum]